MIEPTKDYFNINGEGHIPDNGSTDGPSEGDKTPQKMNSPSAKNIPIQINTTIFKLPELGKLHMERL